MKKIIEFVKRLFCDHIYGDGIMDPFVDEYDRHSATYFCIKCGHSIKKTF